jgi:hypothetical protein
MFKSENNFIRIVEDEDVLIKKTESQEDNKLFDYIDNQICYVSFSLIKKIAEIKIYLFEQKIKNNNKIICKLFENESFVVKLNLNKNIIDYKFVDNNWYLLTEKYLFVCNKDGSLCKRLNNNIFIKAKNILFDNLNR